MTNPDATRAGRRQIVQLTRYASNCLAMEVALGDYREVFFVITGDRSVCITSFDQSDPTRPEPSVFMFPKPYGWTLDLEDDELMVQIWQAAGAQR
jgi:hypothetical protein